MATPVRARLFADDLWDLPDDGLRYEIIDGDLIVAPPPSWAHAEFTLSLGARLVGYVRSNRLGRVAVAPVGVKLDEGTAVEPDIVFVSTANDSVIAERGVEGTPDLVVEVLSPSTSDRDRGIKMRRYARARVPYYWIASTGPRAIEEYELVDGGYALVRRAIAGEIFRPRLFPGLAIEIDAL